MKKLLIATAAVLTLAGPAFAQGLPPGMTTPEYGSHAFPTAQYENGTVFSKIFGHAKDDQAPEHTSNDDTKPANGS
ncbi:MAG: hypothetical protein QOF70_4522 [Acetobacteraceae bacterium]|jgi:hypothetical protein|nr:hypothetical protein [Rhodopila sp.]MEA2730047.1 hypothetical protein [Acetobacteraceae bacterium]